jgi:hypothetical protein
MEQRLSTALTAEPLMYLQTQDQHVKTIRRQNPHSFMERPNSCQIFLAHDSHVM